MQSPCRFGFPTGAVADQVCHSARRAFDAPPVSQAETDSQKVQQSVPILTSEHADVAADPSNATSVCGLDGLPRAVAALPVAFTRGTRRACRTPPMPRIYCRMSSILSSATATKPGMARKISPPTSMLSARLHVHAQMQIARTTHGSGHVRRRQRCRVRTGPAHSARSSTTRAHVVAPWCRWRRTIAHTPSMQCTHRDAAIHGWRRRHCPQRRPRVTTPSKTWRIIAGAIAAIDRTHPRERGLIRR